MSYKYMIITTAFTNEQKMCISSITKENFYEFRPKLEILSVHLPRFLRILIFIVCVAFFIYLYNLFALNTKSLKIFSKGLVTSSLLRINILLFALFSNDFLCIPFLDS
jgi:hypothetical protein